MGRLLPAGRRKQHSTASNDDDDDNDELEVNSVSTLRAASEARTPLTSADDADDGNASLGYPDLDSDDNVDSDYDSSSDECSFGPVGNMLSSTHSLRHLPARLHADSLFPQSQRSLCPTVFRDRMLLILEKSEPPLKHLRPENLMLRHEEPWFDPRLVVPDLLPIRILILETVYWSVREARGLVEARSVANNEPLDIGRGWLLYGKCP